MLLMIVALSSSTIRNAANAWVPQTRRVPTTRSSSWQTTTKSLFMSTENSETDSSRDDDVTRLEQELKIAKLEAELRQLKEKESETETKTETATGPVVVVEEPKKDDLEDDEEIPEEASMDMFVSEGWKEAKEGYDPKNTATVIRKTEEQGNLLGLVAKVVGAIVAVVAFSQIPVGQEDLSKYSAIKSGPVRTTIDLGDTNRVKGQTLNANNFYDSSNELPEEEE